MRSTGSVEPPPAASAPVPAGSVTTSSLMAPSAWEGGGMGPGGRNEFRFEESYMSGLAKGIY